MERGGAGGEEGVEEKMGEGRGGKEGVEKKGEGRDRREGRGTGQEGGRGWQRWACSRL